MASWFFAQIDHLKKAPGWVASKTREIFRMQIKPVVSFTRNTKGLSAQVLSGLQLREIMYDTSYELSQQDIEAVLRGAPRSFERPLVDITARVKQLAASCKPHTNG